MSAGPAPPPDLLAAVQRDLAPVAPRRLGRGLMLWTPLAILACAGLPVVVGIRADAAVLGRWWTWGASAVQLAAALWFVWAGARESRPGRRLPVTALAAALIGAALLVLALTAATFRVSPTVLGDALLPWRAGSFCFKGSVAVGAPLLIVAAGWLGRALPGAPWLAGALFGGGAGLAADATWRLLCPVSDPWHVLASHGGAVLTTAVLGAVLAEVVARWRVARRG
ncbi:MAG: NrsF family protein [Vicinamibacterales bacterium]